MCGLVLMHTGEKIGYMHNDKETLKQLLVINSLRGIHSTGIAGVRLDEDDASIIKCVGSPYALFSQQHTDKFFTRMIQDFTTIIGHGRFATRGVIDAINAHPFKEGHIVLAHNGTINNFYSLKDQNKHKHIEVDSHLVAALIEEEGADAVLPRINGAFVFAWIDLKEHTFNVARNTQRPLFAGKIKGKDTLLFTSEEESLVWHELRNSVTMEEVWEVAPNMIYTYSQGSITPTVRPFKDFVEPPVPKYNNNHSGRRWDYRSESWYDDELSFDSLPLAKPLSKKEQKALDKKNRKLTLVDAKSNQLDLLESLVADRLIEKGKTLTVDIVGFSNTRGNGFMHISCSSEHFPNVRFMATCTLDMYTGHEDSTGLVGVVSSIFKLHLMDNGKSFYVHLNNPRFINDVFDVEDDEDRVVIKTTMDINESLTKYRLKELAKEGCGWCLGHVPINNPKDLLLESSVTEAFQQLICPDCSRGYQEGINPLQH